MLQDMLGLSATPAQPITDSAEGTMHTGKERSATEWFAEARRCYVEQHQGCPRCHASHCVIRSQWESHIEYHCTECDFSAAHNNETGSTCCYTEQPARLRERRLLGEPAEQRPLPITSLPHFTN